MMHPTTITLEHGHVGCANCHFPVAFSADDCSDCMEQIVPPATDDLVCAAGFSCDPDDCPGHGPEDYSMEDRYSDR